MEAKKKRIELLDELRGFAILAMIVHHFFLDVGDILQLDWGYKIFNELCTVQPIFWAIFIIISGICSRLSRNAVKRGLIVFGAGLVITFVTVVIMPRLMGIDGAKIYFGILHCLGACMIITGLAMPLIEKIDARIGVLICAVLFSATYRISSGSLLFGLIFLGEYAKDGKFPSWTYKKHSKALAFVGRNSLWFYLGHQAVLYAVLYAFLKGVEIYYKLKLR